MSASSGIGIAPDLASSFANANCSDHVRFIKVSIENDLLVHRSTIPVTNSFEDDLELLQEQDVLEDNTPAYILAKAAPSDWTAISYVPDSAKVRDKMLYASTRASLLKAIGPALFTDTIFATSRADLTPEAYASHKRHTSAPKPLSAREREMADVRAAEIGSTYEGSRARASHLGTGVGLHWSQDLEEAVRHLGQSKGCEVVVIAIDRASETLTIESTSEASVETIGLALPSSQPCYAFFAWPHTYTSPPRREIGKIPHSTVQRYLLFIYSCPSSSPIKDRMIYSSGVSSTFLAGKALLTDTTPAIYVTPRKIETSDPRELDEAYLKSELGLDVASNSEQSLGPNRDGDERKPFARPKGPARKR